jgi:spore germination protein GerM
MRQLIVVAITVLLVPAGWASQRTPRVYLVHGHVSPLGWRGRLVAVERRDAHSARAVLLALLRGPTAAEERRGIRTAFPDEARLVRVRVAHGTANVDLAGGSRRSWSIGGVYATAQVVYTLTERPGIRRVWLRVDRRRCCVFTHSGRPWPHPLTRRLFVGWQGEPR